LTQIQNVFYCVEHVINKAIFLTVYSVQLFKTILSIKYRVEIMFKHCQLIRHAVSSTKKEPFRKIRNYANANRKRARHFVHSFPFSLPRAVSITRNEFISVSRNPLWLMFPAVQWYRIRNDNARVARWKLTSVLRRADRRA